MRQIFRPAIGLMSRLTYPQKFAVISLLFVLPLATSLTMLVGRIHADVEFTSAELAGTAYLRSLHTLFQHTVEEQFLAAQFLGGDQSARQALMDKHAELTSDVAAIEALQASYGARARIETLHTIMVNRWNQLQAQLDLRSVRDSNAAHVRFMQSIRDLMGGVGDHSNLILDPYLDSSYLMNATLLTLPENYQLLAQFAGLSQDIVRQQQMGPEDRTNLTVLYGLLQANAQEVSNGFGVAYQQGADQQIRRDLQPGQQAFNQTIDQLLADVDANLIRTPRMSIQDAPLRQAVEAGFGANTSLWDSTIAELDRVLSRRIATLSRQRNLLLALALAMLGLVVYLLIGFYLAVMKTVGGFRKVTERMVSGDFSQRVDLTSRDELGQVAVSFNTIAASLVEASARRQAIVEHAVHSILTFDDGGQITSVNPAATRLFGSADLVGRPITDLLDSDIESLRASTALRELTGRRHDGTPFIAEVGIGQEHREAENTWIAFVRDISLRKTAEAERGRLQEEMIRAQAVVLAELSMPLIPITGKIMVMPLIGAMDSERAAQLITTLLRGIETQHTRVAIVDVTGVPVLDSHVAQGLIQAAAGVRLLGTELVLTGIRPDVAQTLVQLGLDLNMLTTRGTLESGIAYALQRTV
jgi:PAS domain S-box-containing protein